MIILCEPKHVAAAVIILNILLIQGFYNLCWTIKCLILLMHGTAMNSYWPIIQCYYMFRLFTSAIIRYALGHTKNKKRRNFS